MNCVYCNGVDTVEEQLTRFCACETPRPFIVENVPAFVCRLCGDKSFSGEAVSELEKMKNGEVQINSLQILRVFDFQQIDKPGTSATSGINVYTMAGQVFNENVAISYGRVGMPLRWGFPTLNLGTTLPDEYQEWVKSTMQPKEMSHGHRIVNFRQEVTAPHSFSYTLP